MRFIKTTVIGGIVFLIPIVIVLMVIGEVLDMAGQVAAPLVELLPVQAIGDLALAHLLAFGILVLLCSALLCGWAAGPNPHRPTPRRVARGPGALEGAGVRPDQKQDSEHAEPRRHQGHGRRHVRFDDCWQIAFAIERVDGGGVAVFLPGAPDPWSGSMCVVSQDRVTPLDANIPIIVEIVKRLGRGANEALRDRWRTIG